MATRRGWHTSPDVCGSILTCEPSRAQDSAHVSSSPLRDSVTEITPMPHVSSNPGDVWSTEYENYHETAKAYDDTRSPVGVEIILGCFASSPKALHEQTILDGGCGTGNYITAMQKQIRTMHGLDLNQGML